MDAPPEVKPPNLIPKAMVVILLTIIAGIMVLCIHSMIFGTTELITTQLPGKRSVRIQRRDYFHLSRSDYNPYYLMFVRQYPSRWETAISLSGPWNCVPWYNGKMTDPQWLDESTLRLRMDCKPTDVRVVRPVHFVEGEAGVVRIDNQASATVPYLTVATTRDIFIIFELPPKGEKTIKFRLAAPEEILGCAILGNPADRSSWQRSITGFNRELFYNHDRPLERGSFAITIQDKDIFIRSISDDSRPSL